MAEIDTSGGAHKKGPGVKKNKKQSTRVDLTPMVDLGFLLITFFIFTTTMSQATAMRLFLPKDTDDPDKTKASGALTLLPGKNDVVYYYEGLLAQDGSNFRTTNFKDLRDVVITRKKSTKPQDFVVVIKPHAESTYKNAVDILDEMSINDVKRYALVDISPVESQLIVATQGN
jgi:biopolymer transport protein ExbD